jgi:hypothetical protein
LKTLNFHIGSGRCGSTLIQALFNDAGIHQVFEKHALNYNLEIYQGTGMIAHDDTFIEENKASNVMKQGTFRLLSMNSRYKTGIGMTTYKYSATSLAATTFASSRLNKRYIAILGALGF